MSSYPTERELRAWAAEPCAPESFGHWDLVLSWDMDSARLHLFVELAADPTLPNAWLFLLVLYRWVSYAARQKDFDSWRPHYDRWLDEVRGVRDPSVKRWRNRARRIFQGLDAFDDESWWDSFAADANPTE
ncbi:MAG TPA: hypothetical protein VF179_22175 [Thermoanaerobaculia bacterium]|nr:hypothetical protein [Thermoanaerobaculia bacterium]